jgi:hypothetical protein
MSIRFLITLFLATAGVLRTVSAYGDPYEESRREELKAFEEALDATFSKLSAELGDLSPAQKGQVAEVEKAIIVRAKEARWATPALADVAMQEFQQILVEGQRPRSQRLLKQGKLPIDGFVSRVKLRRIGGCLIMHANEYRDSLPADLGKLVGFVFDMSAADFVSPLSGKSVREELLRKDATQAPQWVNEHSDYVYLGSGAQKRSKLPDRFVLVHEREGLNPEGIHIYRADMTVQFLKGEDAKKFLAEIRAGHNPPTQNP